MTNMRRLMIIAIIRESKRRNNSRKKQKSMQNYIIFSFWFALNLCEINGMCIKKKIRLMWDVVRNYRNGRNSNI